MNNIILIGFMGAGKDSIANEIGTRTGLVYFSIDKYIEYKENKTIKRIFNENGELYFRKLETIALKRIKGVKNLILSTGGGIILSKINRELLKKMGEIIYLKTDINELKKRLKDDDERPLLKEINDIESLYRQREKLYGFAKYKIDTSGKSIHEIIDLIIKKFELKRKSSPVLHKTITIRTLAKVYPVFIGENISGNIPEYIDRIKKDAEKIIIVSNPIVAALFLNRIKKTLTNKFQVINIIIDEGEENKNLESVKKIYELLLKERVSRNDILLALGGGIVGDITGFVASTFKRGMGFIQVPTTLLSQVDASIGGKTGVNHKAGKNMIGSFYQPDMVVIDTVFLKTLPENIFRSGISEIIKYAVIKDSELFSILNNYRAQILERESSLLSEIISRCVKIKGEVVENDEKEEASMREILNFGHTIGHIVEVETNYRKFSHGEAVAMGMVEESKIAVKKGILDKKDFEKIKRLIGSYKLPNDLPENITTQILKESLSQDKKVRNGRLKLPIPQKIGKTDIKEVLCKDYL